MHRARYIGVSGGKPSEVPRRHAGPRACRDARATPARRLVIPDENATWALTAIPAGIRLVREHRDRCRRVHVAARLDASDRGAIARATYPLGRPTCATRSCPTPHRRADTTATKAKAGAARARRAARASRRDAITCVSEAISEGDEGARPQRTGGDDPERRRLRRRCRPRAQAIRPLPYHAHGQLLRPPRPAPLPAGAARLRARRRRPLPGRLPRDRPRLGRGLGLGERLELLPYAPARRVARAAAGLGGAPSADPRCRRPGKGVLSGRSSSTSLSGGPSSLPSRPTEPQPS